MNFNVKQKNIVISMLLASIFSIGFILIAYYSLPLQLWKIDEVNRITFTIRCDIFAFLTLLFGIMLVANQRFFSPTAIDGETTNIEQKITINIHYISNTLEQCTLLLITHLTLSTILTIPQMRLIPILVALFIIARFLFWYGYHNNPNSRAFGFVASFYPTAILMLYACVKISI